MATSESSASKLQALKESIYSCSRCGFCRIWDWKGVDWVCPTYPYTEGFDTQYARGRLNMAQQYLEGIADVDAAFLEHLAQCTLCGNCATHCPVGLPLLEIWEAFRSDLVKAGHVYPPHQRTVENVRQYHNVFGPRTGKTVERKQPRKVNVLYFPGCQTTRKARSIGKATTDLLDKLNVDFALLDDDVCCGYPLYDIGQMDALRENAAHTVAKIAEYQPDIVLTTCSGCYRALKVVYPEDLGLTVPAQVQHTHEFFPKRLDGKLKNVQRKVTFHDPCIMSRHMSICDEPRAVIASIPGVDLVEMYSNCQNSACCGGGGGVLSAFDEISSQVAVERLQQAAATGAEQLVTSCPTCVVSLKRAVRRAGVNLEVTDMVELLNEAVSGD